MADSIAEHQRLVRWIPELFAPVTGPTRPSGEKESVRFGLGEYELPGKLAVFNHWAVVRGLVWAFRKEAPTAWRELTALAQEAVDGLTAQWMRREEPDCWVVLEGPEQWDHLFLAHAAVRFKNAGLSLKIPSLRSEEVETLASRHQREPLIVPNFPDIQAWRAKWNLADDRSLFTVALVAEAVKETDQFRELSATNSAWVTSGSLFDAGVPQARGIPGVAPPPAESPEAAVPPPDPQALRFEYPEPNLAFEIAATHKTAARKAFKRALDAHIAERRAYWTARGHTPVSVMRVPDIHFRWYIKFHVLEQTQRKIADDEFAEEKTVSRELLKLATLAGVPLRESKRGRRRKKQPPAASGIST